MKQPLGELAVSRRFMPNRASVRTVAGCCFVLLSFFETCHIDDASATRFPCSGSQIKNQPKVLCIWLKRCQRLKKTKKIPWMYLSLYKNKQMNTEQHSFQMFCKSQTFANYFLSQLLWSTTPEQKKVTEICSLMQFLPKPTTKIKHFDYRNKKIQICVIFERLIMFDW